jgi:hypothetical protein
MIEGDVKDEYMKGFLEVAVGSGFSAGLGENYE